VLAAGELPFGREQRVVAQDGERRVEGLGELEERRRVRIAGGATTVTRTSSAQCIVARWRRRMGALNP
jgi:hypothetical protein